MSEVKIKGSDNHIELSGELSVDTVSERLFSSIFRGSSNLIVDLADVSRIDTAGLAWLVLLFKNAKLNGCTIELVNSPDALTNLAKLSDVDKLLGLQ